MVSAAVAVDPAARHAAGAGISLTAAAPPAMPRGCLQHAAGVAGRHTTGHIQPRRGDCRKAHRKGRPPSIAPAAASQVAGIDGPSFGRCFALTRSQPSSAPDLAASLPCGRRDSTDAPSVS
ncbi:uncharacterized protein [Miscanthus floridulus]|uniref:uncharacterized protein isoform X2 n=1 Tax=Miscanthus floridulus TaxID=154761 RepID=UPI003458A3A4